MKPDAQGSEAPPWDLNENHAHMQPTESVRQLLANLARRCRASPIFVKATEREWAWLVATEAHRQVLFENSDGGIEYHGCMVVPPWVKVREPRPIVYRPPVRTPAQYANHLLRQQGHADLVNEKLEPRHAPLRGHRRR